jgi:hypothetical protein
VSTAEEDQNPETQSRPPREHLAAPPDVADAGAFGDHAGADQLRGRKEWRRLLDLARARQHPRPGSRLLAVRKPDRASRSALDGASAPQEPRIDTTTASGEALYRVTLAWPQLEQRQHPQAGPRERVKAGMDRGRAAGP